MTRPEFSQNGDTGIMFYDGTHYDSKKFRCVMTSYGGLSITHDRATEKALFTLYQKGNRGITSLEIQPDTVTVRKTLPAALPQSEIASIYNRDLQLTTTTCAYLPLSHTDRHRYIPTFHEFLVNLTITKDAMTGKYIESIFQGNDQTPVQIPRTLNPLPRPFENMTMIGDSAVIATVEDGEKNRTVMMALTQFGQPCMDLVIPRVAPLTHTTWWSWYQYPYEHYGADIAQTISALSPAVIQ